MVRLRVLYGVGLALAVVVAAVPATREAGWQSLRWSFGREEFKLAQGLVFREVDAAAVAAEIGEAWAWAAAAECSPARSPGRRELLERAARTPPTNRHIQLHRAAVAVGQLHETSRLEICWTTDPGQLGWARESLTAAIADDPQNGYLWLLGACSATAEGRWDEAQRALVVAWMSNRVGTGHAAVLRDVERLYVRGGLPRADAAMVAADGIRTDLAAIRRMARSFAEQAGHVRASGDLAGSARMLRDLARAGERLRREADTYDAAALGVSVEKIAFEAAGNPGVGAKPADDDPALAGWLARQFATLMSAAGLRQEAIWALAEPARWQALREARIAEFRASAAVSSDAQLEGLKIWNGLACVLVWSILLLPPYAWLLTGLGKPLAPLVWRWRQIAPMLAIGLLVPLGVAWRHVPQIRNGCLCDMGCSVEGIASGVYLAGALWIAAIAWLLGWLHARRTVANPGWARFREACRFAARAVVVPALAAQAVLLILALGCAIPMAIWRDRVADAFESRAELEQQVLARVETRAW